MMSQTNAWHGRSFRQATQKTNPSAENYKTPRSTQLNHDRLVWNNFLAPSIRRRRLEVCRIPELERDSKHLPQSPPTWTHMRKNKTKENKWNNESNNISITHAHTHTHIHITTTATHAHARAPCKYSYPHVNMHTRWYSRGNYFLSEPHLNIRTNSGYFQHPNINYNSSVATTVWKTTYICHQLLKSIARSARGWGLNRSSIYKISHSFVRTQKDVVRLKALQRQKNGECTAVFMNARAKDPATAELWVNHIQSVVNGLKSAIEVSLRYNHSFSCLLIIIIYNY